MAKYVNLSKSVEASDFLLSLAGALGEAMDADTMLGNDATREGYWERAAAFLSRTKLEIEGVSLKRDALDLKLNLQADPTPQATGSGASPGRPFGPLTEDVHAYVRELVAALRAKHGPATQLVLLVDSLERMRGISPDDQRKVQSSLAELFGSHSEKLALPSVHVVSPRSRRGSASSTRASGRSTRGVSFRSSPRCPCTTPRAASRVTSTGSPRSSKRGTAIGPSRRSDRPDHSRVGRSPAHAALARHRGAPQDAGAPHPRGDRHGRHRSSSKRFPSHRRQRRGVARLDRDVSRGASSCAR